MPYHIYLSKVQVNDFNFLHLLKIHSTCCLFSVLDSFLPTFLASWLNSIPYPNKTSISDSALYMVKPSNIGFVSNCSTHSRRVLAKSYTFWLIGINLINAHFISCFCRIIYCFKKISFITKNEFFLGPSATKRSSINLCKLFPLICLDSSPSIT